MHRLCGSRMLCATAVALTCALAWADPSADGPDVTPQQYEFGSIWRAHLTLGESTWLYTEVPKSVAALKVALVPIYGDTDAYMAFNSQFSGPAEAQFRMDNAGMEELILRRSSPEFAVCDAAAGDCTLRVMLFGYSTSDFLFAVTNLTDPSVLDPTTIECAEGCQHFELSDNTCHPECNTTACLYDAGDCLVQDSYCNKGCPHVWTGDNICDEACFNEDCDWDGGDCTDGSAEPGCSDGCVPYWIGDATCDEECNNAACDWDGSDCYHDHDECYLEDDGRDYRGTVAVTASGKPCQYWSHQYPHQHTRTANFYPWAGLGGHNFCRNPDGEAGPWCYTMDPDSRWELCDIGVDKSKCDEAAAEVHQDQGEVAVGEDGGCPADHFQRAPGVCAKCTECDNGMEERMPCTSESNRICAPACALSQANRVVSEGKGAISAVQALCGYGSYDGRDYSSFAKEKLCAQHCCTAFDIASDACDYDGAHQETWQQVKETIMLASEELCKGPGTMDCHPMETAMLAKKGTKYVQLEESGNLTVTVEVAKPVTTGDAMHNPVVVTVLTVLAAGLCVLGIGLLWYQRRVKATLNYASPNAPEEMEAPDIRQG